MSRNVSLATDAGSELDARISEEVGALTPEVMQ